LVGIGIFVSFIHISLQKVASIIHPTSKLD
jgi:hypothetical protein